MNTTLSFGMKDKVYINLVIMMDTINYGIFRHATLFSFYLHINLLLISGSGKPFIVKLFKG